jgi:hypothetical protein
MQEQAKTATPTPNSTTTITTTSSFEHLPNEVQQQILECLNSHELVTGIGTSARWLRKLCLPLVKEVHIVIPYLQHASEVARLNGLEAGLALLPTNVPAWKNWTKQEGGKLAAGLLGHLPNVEVIHGSWNAHFSNILGLAVCRLDGPRYKLRDFGHRPGEKFLELAETPIDFLSLARAMAEGLLPSLTRVDSITLFLHKQASLMKVAQAISEGHLPNLVRLHLCLEDKRGESTVMEAFARAYIRRLQVQGTGGAEQAKLKLLEIDGTRDQGVQSHVRLLLDSPYTQELSILHLGNSNQHHLFATAMDYVCGPEALATKRPHLQNLTLPCLYTTTYCLINRFVEALTIHQVCPNLQSLGFFKIDGEIISGLAQIYERGHFRNLAHLDLGFLDTNSPFVRQFLLQVSECPNKGRALKRLVGNHVEDYDVDTLAADFSDGLKAGAFPELQELILWNVFECGNGVQHLIDAMTAATPAVETCRHSLRRLHINDLDAEEEAALRNLLGGEELTIVSSQDED